MENASVTKSSFNMSRMLPLDMRFFQMDLGLKKAREGPRQLGSHPYGEAGTSFAVQAPNGGMRRAAALYNGIKGIATFTHWRSTMAEGPYGTRRTNPRFAFFANAEVTLRDGTSVSGQLDELSSRGCYIDALEPIPIRTKLQLRISDGTSTCELHGKVIYMHSGGGFGIFGMGVLFEEMDAEQRSAIEKWLRELAAQARKDLGNNPASRIRG